LRVPKAIGAHPRATSFFREHRVAALVRSTILLDRFSGATRSFSTPTAHVGTAWHHAARWLVVVDDTSRASIAMSFAHLCTRQGFEKTRAIKEV